MKNLDGFDRYVISTLVNDEVYEKLCKEHKDLLDRGLDVSNMDDALGDFFRIRELEAVANERVSFLEKMCDLFYKRKN